MKAYRHLPGYLHRWVVCKMGRFMLRVHEILDTDQTPFLHSHPFHYLSIIVKGGYTELVLQPDGTLKEITHKRWSVILRGPSTYHRIKSLHGECSTLFFTWKSPKGWNLMRHREVPVPAGYNNYPDGFYFNVDGWRIRRNGIWYPVKRSRLWALEQTQPSIHQNLTLEPGNYRYWDFRHNDKLYV